MFFIVFDRIIELFLTLSFQNQTNILQTPKFNTLEQPKLNKLLFGQDKNQKEDKKSSGIKVNSTNEKHWEETIKILIPSFSKILRKFCSLPFERFFITIQYKFVFFSLNFFFT